MCIRDSLKARGLGNSLLHRDRLTGIEKRAGGGLKDAELLRAGTLCAMAEHQPGEFFAVGHLSLIHI